MGADAGNMEQVIRTQMVQSLGGQQSFTRILLLSLTSGTFLSYLVSDSGAPLVNKSYRNSLKASYGD